MCTDIKIWIEEIISQEAFYQQKAIQIALFCFSVVSFIVYIVTVSGISSYMEDWNLTAGFYYWVVNLTRNGFPTIGFVKSNLYSQFFMKI